jgi:exodeoxyribonuclease VII small subunit
MKETSFEKALEKLENIVNELEEGDLSLDNSLKKYEEGIKLARICQQKLDKAKQKIELLMKDESGSFRKKAFHGKSEEE